MKIYELRLKNCKCYEDKTINFQEGINFISGVNGAGKTTIIEAIGFVLFNHLPYNAKQFLRDGKNSGEVQVLIEAKDERLYRVIRKFNKQSKGVKWEVYDEETDTALDELHGNNDVSRWIKENIGVDPEDSLGKIFEQVIAVNQGLFTAPFLETSANRKRIFDDILKVEGYREAFDKSRSLKSFIDGEGKVLQEKIDYIEKEIEKIPAVEEETVEKIAEEKEKTEQHKAALQKKKEMEDKEAEWTKLKEDVESKKNKKKLLEQERTSLKETIGALYIQKQEAAAARKVIEETKEAYERYQQNQKDLKNWEDKKKEKDNLHAELEKKVKTYAAEEKGMEVEAKNIQQREKELTERREELQKYKDKNTENLQGIEKNLEEINSWIDKTKLAGSSFDAVESWFHNKRKLLINAVYELEKIEELTSQIQEIQEKLQDLPLQEKELAGLSMAIKKGEELYLEKSSLEARKKALKQNESHLLEGRCPIIQEECPSTKVAGDLSGFFAKELNEIDSGLHEVKEKLALLEKQKEKYEKLKTTVDLAKEDEKRKGGLEKTREHNLKKLRKLLESISFKELSDVIAKGQREHVTLENLVREINLWAESKDFISQGLFTCKGLDDKECFDLLDELKDAAAEDAGQIRNWLTQWDQLDAEGERWLEKGQDEANDMKQWLNHILQDVKLRTQKIKQQEEHCLGEIAANDRQAKDEKEKTADLDHRRKKLGKLGDDIGKIKGDLEQYAPVEGMVDDLKKELVKDQGHYEKYKENQQTSKRLEKVEQEIKEYQARAEKNTQEIERVSKILEQLLNQYEPEKHEELVRELKEVTTRVTELNFSLKQMEKDIDSLKKQLEELLKKKEEWEKNQRTLLVKKKAGELAQIIRNTLKNAADPIAQVYRRHLSIQANEIYRHVSNENTQLEWASEYELQLKDNHHSKERTRVFKQLSGGEQMTAALAVRLALMKMLSDVKVGFFDEPTTNLDASRRQNLAASIQNSTRGFDQLFVISHDDAFDALTENIISLEKDDGHGTRVSVG